MNIQLLVIIIILVVIKVSGSVNPLSKITVKSGRATLHKSMADVTEMILTYQDNVRVTLADKSQISAQHLEIAGDKSLLSTSTISKSSTVSSQKAPLNSITFSDKVVMVRDNRTVSADRAVISPATQECRMVGNVVIEQTKKSEHDIPLVTQGQELVVNLKTGSLSVEGSKDHPVTTVIEFAQPESPVAVAASSPASTTASGGINLPLSPLKTPAV